MSGIRTGDVKMFPSLEMPVPTDAPSDTFRSSRKAKKSIKAKLPGKPGSSVESQHLPGLLTTVKPTIKPASNGNDVSVLVGFNAAGVKFDGETIRYDDKIVGKTQTILPGQPMLNTANLNDIHVDKLKEKADPSGKNKGDLIVEELRNYTTLMDNFSLHNFVIYQGETLKNTPEFQSFRRQYTNEWGSISHLITTLEEIMQQFVVKLAIINGPALHALASLNKAAVTKDEVLNCVSNIEQIKPHLRSTVTGEVNNEISFWQQFRAVVKIQSLIRQYLCRRRVRKLRLQLMGCIRIQSYLRKVIYRKFGLDRLRADRQELNDRFAKSQAVLHQIFETQESAAESHAQTFARSAFNERTLNSTSGHGERYARLLIFIPGVRSEEYLRLEYAGFDALQNASIGFLHQLVDPDVHIIYVTPVPVSTEMEAYYDKFLGMMGISTLPRRLHFIYPELARRIPQHVPLSQVLWCSAAAVRKIKQHVRRIPRAIIVTGNISWIERRICTMMNLPLLSCEPVVVEQLNNRSYAKKMLMEATVNIPIGAHDIFSQDDLYIALSRLIASNVDINRWLIRLNLDCNNESTLVLEVHKMEVVHALRSEQVQLIEQNGTSQSWFSRAVQLSVRKRILVELKATFEKTVKICRPDIYASYTAFGERMHRIGAVIEAVPIELLGHVDGMCFVSPTGCITFYAGLDVLVDEHWQSQMMIGPPSVISTKALAGATEAVATYLHNKWKYTGYLTVQFQAFWDGLDNLPRLWGLGVYCGHTPQWGAMGTAAVAMNPSPYIPQHVIPLAIPNFSVNEGTVKKLAAGKHCLYVPLVVHEPLKGVRDDVFFKFCIMRGIAFDKVDKTGLLFFLVDSIMGGRLSFVSVANSRYRALEQAISSITYITQQFGKDGTGRNVEHMASLLLNLKKALKVEERSAGPLTF